jgi:DNA replication licensing factor MCM4
MYSH